MSWDLHWHGSTWIAGIHSEYWDKGKDRHLLVKKKEDKESSFYIGVIGGGNEGACAGEEERSCECETDSDPKNRGTVAISASTRMSHDDVTTTHSRVLNFFHLILYFNYISINFKILAVKKNWKCSSHAKGVSKSESNM